MFQPRDWDAQLLLDEQLAVVPPPWPVHDHVYGPAPETAVGEPAAQRLVLGAVEVLPPLAAPQLPLMICTHEVADVLQVPCEQDAVAEPEYPAAVLASDAL